MKKIYSIVLMATALLIGTNVWADVKTFEALRDAIQNAEAGATVDITIGEKITFPEGSTITIDKGQTVNLNLGANEISFADAPAFHIYHGHMTVSGTNGLIKSTSEAKKKEYRQDANGKYIDANGNIVSTQSKAMIYYVPDKGIAFELGGTENDNDANYSTLVIENGVTVQGHSRGVHINYLGTAANMTHKTSKNVAYLGAENYEGKVKGCSFGTKVDVYGAVSGDKYGLQISGNVAWAPAPGTKVEETNVPYIHVHPTAVITSQPDSLCSSGIYCAGYGRIVIEGTVHAATGVYVKSGVIDVTGKAKVSSDADSYLAAAGKSSGVGCSGSAIVMDSNKAYAGAIDITISGQATVEGKSGYAVEAKNTTSPESKVEGVTLAGGVIKGGDQGCMDVAPVIADDAEKIVIDGSEFDNAKNDEIQTILAAISTETGQEYVLGQIEKDGKVVVVAQPLPAGETKENNTSINNLQGAEYVDWDNHQEVLNTDGVKLEKLQLFNNSQLTIPAGKAIEIGSVTLDATSSIIVKASDGTNPAGALYITGKNGVVAFKNTNLIIEAYDGGNAIFMMSPKVEAQKNPAATVKLTSKGYKRADGSYQFQLCGVPAIDGMTRSDMDYASATAIYQWINGGWKAATSTTLLMPFVGLQITSQATAPGEVYSMPGNLVGNSDGPLNLTSKWNSFANSYTANVELATLIEAMYNDGGVDASAYVYRAEDDMWDAIGYYDVQDYLDGDATAMLQTKLSPMQAFLFNSPAGNDYTFNINYAENVWYPVFPADKPASGSGAPARKRVANNITKAVINITSENGITERVTVRQDARFSNEYENGADMEKFMNEKSFNAYATTENGNMVQLATNNLEGQVIAVATKNETNFKMTFTNVKGEQLAIRDNLTGSTIAMTEGNEYVFTVADNTVSERFQIVGVNNAPTDVETVVANEGAKAIYTVLGQYMGTTDDWSILPAGIYVVDGVKVVK